MGILDSLGLESALHAVSQALLLPTVVLLFALAAYAVYTIGSFVVEIVVERRSYAVSLPRLIADIDAADVSELPAVIESSGLLDTQRERLTELVSYLYLPEDSRVEVARKLLADEADRYARALSWTENASKVAPMLGLMGTLIPLGPGLIGLSSGDLDTLSSALIVAFDTTVVGLAVAAVCFLVSRTRRRWYDGYLASIEGAMNAILEKADLSDEDGGNELARDRRCAAVGRHAAAAGDDEGAGHGQA